MERNKTIPHGYMTVGEVAKKMDVTVRTLQYYDREGLLSPSSESEGGRRLYTDKDLVKLHQILSLKHLGFSLDDIKNRLIPLDTPAAVSDVLEEQAAAIRRNIETLSESLNAIETLRTEVLQMQTVDFRRYADIIVNLKMKNEFYWLIKHFDDQILDHIRGRFDKESGLAFIHDFITLQDDAIRLLDSGALPESEEGQLLAEAFWNMIMEFTGGDMSMLPKLMETGYLDSPDGSDGAAEVNNGWKQKQAAANTFLEPALEVYLTKLNIDPFKEEEV